MIVGWLSGVILLAATLLTSSFATAINQHWTICSSFPNSTFNTQNYIPPSKWNTTTYTKQCFLHRNDTTSTPGTALFQYLLHNYYYQDGIQLRAENSRTTNDSRFNPYVDFPTWDVIQHYPDIGIDAAGRDYFTLWYTTQVDISDLQSSSSDSGIVNRVYSLCCHFSHWNQCCNKLQHKRGHLKLHGVNYHPMVYFNGKLLQPYSTTTTSNDRVDVGGMFLRRHYDLGTDYLYTSSSSSIPLEILVLPPPHVGKPIKLNSTSSNHYINKKYGLEEGQGGDHNIAKSGAIMQFTAGWDWIQSTPDRNVGIYDRVDIEWIDGDVRLHDLYVRIVNITTQDQTEENGEMKLPLGDDVIVSAWLDLSLTLTNHQQSDNPINGQFQYWITPSTSSSNILTSGTIDNISIQQSVIDYQLGQVQLPNAKLWWPHSHSTRHRQPLYTVHVKFTSNNVNDSAAGHQAQTQATFGVRTVSSYTHHNTKSFALKVNGHAVFLTGGNWITSDQFLRYHNSPRRYLQELSLIRHLGMNSIRVWGGGIAESDHFYNTADSLGLLVYQEFWMTGDNNGRMAGSYDWPIDHDAYLVNVEDTIKRLRNHPSLCLYAAGNELYPIPSSTSSPSVGTNPPRDIESKLENYIADLDGSRPYVTSSVSRVGNDFDPTRTLGPKDGPYTIQPEAIFFNRNGAYGSPLLTEDEIKQNIRPSDVEEKDSSYRNIGFQTEVGSVSHPELESLTRFLSPEALISYPNCGEPHYLGQSVHEEWSYFKFISFSEKDTGVDHICQFAYPPHDYDSFNATSKHRMESIEDYTWAAQFAQYLQYKSLFEGYTYKMREWYSAVFLWKVSSPAPTFRGALYDTYLATNGGYWGARAGLARGGQVRVVLNLRDWTVHVINALPTAISSVSVKWSAFSLNCILLNGGEIPIPDDSIIHGDTVVHLKDSLPWVGLDKSSLTKHKVQDVVIYRLEMSYVDDLGTTGKATNSYYLTDPSIQATQSRYALLGGLRKEMPPVSLDVSCTMDSGINCTLQNKGDVVAVMARLQLVRDTSNSPVNSKDGRILPALFSDNYITLLPGEESYIHVLLEHIDPSILGIMLKCSSNGYVEIMDHRANDNLMVSVDGWNVKEKKVHIMCGTYTTLA